MGTKIEGTVAAIVYDAEGHEVARLSDIRGVWEGRKDLLFKSEKRMAFSLVVGPLEHGQANIQMTMNFRQWYNYRLLQLPYFDVLDMFVSAVVKHNNVTLEFAHLGQKLVPMKLELGEKSIFNEYAVVFELVRKARHVAKAFNLNPQWLEADALDENKMRAVEIAYGVLIEKQFVFDDPSRELMLDISLPKSVLDQDRTLPVDLFAPMGERHTVSFLGQTIPAKGYVLEMRNGRLHTSEQECEEKRKAGTEGVRLRYSSLPPKSTACLRTLGEDEQDKEGFIAFGFPDGDSQNATLPSV